MRRARILDMSDDDPYKRHFLVAGSANCGWSHASTQLLSEWKVPDRDVLRHVYPEYESYKYSVESSLAQKCMQLREQIIQCRSSVIPYSSVTDERSGILSTIPERSSCSTQINLRSHLRFRCGLVEVSHVAGKRSSARFQSCRFCDTEVRNGVVHVLAKCTVFAAERNTFLTEADLHSASPDKVCLAVLRCPADSSAFEAACALCAVIDRKQSVSCGYG